MSSIPTYAEFAVAPTQHVFASCEVFAAGVSQGKLSLSGGSVTADATRSMMRDGSITVAPGETASERSLDEAFDLLVTPGVELQISRGFVLPSGSRQAVAVGRFVVQEVARQRGAESLAVRLADLSQRISRARWTDPYQIAAGTSLCDALNDLLRDRWPDVVSAIWPSVCPDVLGAQAIFEAGADSDPWADAVGLAKDHGYLLYFDVAGRASVARIADALRAPSVFTFERGARAIVTESTRTAPLERVYNGVIVSGEGSAMETPVRGEAWDTNPASRTYCLGPLGKVPRFYSSSLITTAAQAEEVAAAMLAGILGRVEQLSWQHVPHPGLKPLDVVAVEQEGGVLASYVLDAVTIPLGISEPMSAVAREIQVAF